MSKAATLEAELVVARQEVGEWKLLTESAEFKLKEARDREGALRDLLLLVHDDLDYSGYCVVEPDGHVSHHEKCPVAQALSDPSGAASKWREQVKQEGRSEGWALGLLAAVSIAKKEADSLHASAAKALTAGRESVASHRESDRGTALRIRDAITESLGNAVKWRERVKAEGAWEAVRDIENQLVQGESFRFAAKRVRAGIAARQETP